MNFSIERIADAPIEHLPTSPVSASVFFEFLQRQTDETRQFELHDGEIIEMSGGTGGQHGEVTALLTMYILLYVIDNRLGRVTAAETCYALHQNPDGKDVVQCPDAAFVALARAPEPLDARYIPFAPDLAVEVISPSNDAETMHTKVLNYLRYGTQLVWVVYPQSKTAVVHTVENARTLNPDDTLDGGDVLPGFTLPVRAIFPE